MATLLNDFRQRYGPLIIIHSFICLHSCLRFFSAIIRWHSMKCNMKLLYQNKMCSAWWLSSWVIFDRVIAPVMILHSVLYQHSCLFYFSNPWMEFNQIVHEASIPRGDVQCLMAFLLNVIWQLLPPWILNIVLYTNICVLRNHWMKYNEI